MRLDGVVSYDGIDGVGSSYGKYLEILYSKLFHGYTSTFTINLGQPDYWWLRSPDIVADSNIGAYYMRPDGDVDSVWNLKYSYVALRTSLTTTALICSTRMATSSTTSIGVSQIPTAIICLSGY